MDECATNVLTYTWTMMKWSGVSRSVAKRQFRVPFVLCPRFFLESICRIKLPGNVHRESLLTRQGQ